VLSESGVNNGIFLGHGYGVPLPLARVEDKRARLAQRLKIRFLHVAGHNPKIRKNTNQVIEAFSLALSLRNDIELTITSMDPVSTYYQGELPSGITILDRCLSRDEILDLYEAHDVSIQVPSHEGLGLGFYESLCRSTPILSLDCPPHNEIVLEGETGWLIPARPKNMPDNERAIVDAWRFNTTDLISRIIWLDREAIDKVILSAGEVYKTRFDEVALLTRIMQTIPSGNMQQLSNESIPVDSITDATLPHARPVAVNTNEFIAKGQQDGNMQQLSNESIPVDSIVDATLPHARPVEVNISESIAKGPQEKCEVLTPASKGVKFAVKRILFKTLQATYKLAKPFTRRIAFRLRILMIDAIADLRQEISTLSNVVRDTAKEQTLMRNELFTLTHDVRDTAKEQTLMRNELFTLTHDVRDTAKEQTLMRNELFTLTHDVRDTAKEQTLLCHQLTMLSEAIDSLNWNVLKAGNAVATLSLSSRTTLEDAISRLASLEDAISRLASLEDAISRLASLEDAISRLASLEDAISRLASLEDAISRLASLEDAISRLASLEDAISRLASLEDAISRLASLEDAIFSIRGVLNETHREVKFIKYRTATYAGQGAVLTYLKDESPIYVNAGDLGCPSPIINGGIWEPENLSVLYSLVTSNTVFLDIGANIGYFSIAIGNRIKREGRVFAIEPHPRLTNLIERSLQLNSLENVVQIFQCAASDQEGTVDLFYPDNHLGKGSSSRKPDEQGEYHSVQAHRVDMLLPKNMTVDLIKIDVEGHELNVLRGMQEVLQRSPNVKVLFEKLELSKAEAFGIASLMRNHGFDLYGVGANAVLIPLDIDGYIAWIGDVLAAPPKTINTLTRTGFSVYPGQLSGTGQANGSITTYTAKQAGVLFFGPDWFLGAGVWQIQLHGHISGSVRMVIVAEHQTVIAEIKMSEVNLKSNFTVTCNITHFEVRAYVEAGTIIDLERIEFQQCVNI
jgi:FkbM family methyltransferase